MFLIKLDLGHPNSIVKALLLQTITIPLIEYYFYQTNLILYWNCLMFPLKV